MLYVCPSFHNSVFYYGTVESMLAKKQALKQIRTPPDPRFIGNGYLQHAGAGRGGSQCWHDHLYLIHKDVKPLELKDFVYGTGSFIVLDHEEEAVQGQEQEAAPQNTFSSQEISTTAISHDNVLTTSRKTFTEYNLN